MCDCDIDSSEIFEGNICLAEDVWLLRNDYYFGDYIYIDCDFCTSMKEYPDIRICSKLLYAALLHITDLETFCVCLSNFSIAKIDNTKSKMSQMQKIYL
ncbi:hypothetical protein mvi_113 [Megavirus vitis]|nr:hypothetical protein mvi_113 [Megavirus vitis]